MSSKKNKNKAKKAAMTALQNAHNEVSPGEEMYMAPVRDPNTKMTRPASLAGKIDDSKFIVLWTHCINSMCTIPQGRRVPLTHAVRDPIVGEMSEVLTYFKLVHVIEPFKCYPRDREKKIGRVRVQLVGEVSSGVPLPTKYQTGRQAGRQAGRQETDAVVLNHAGGLMIKIFMCHLFLRVFLSHKYIFISCDTPN